MKLYLSVRYERANWGKHDLYEKDFVTFSPPGKEERVMLYPDGPMLEVKERYWEDDGTVCADLQTVIIDPHEQDQVSIRGHGPSTRRYAFWFSNSTDIEKTLAQMEDHGWVKS
jgi:hypothetical protein